MRLNPPKRPSRRAPDPVVPGLSPYLTQEAALARATAAAERDAESNRRGRVRQLADRVAAVPPPVRPVPAPTPAPTVAAPEKPAEPWREGPLVVRKPPKRERPSGPLVIPLSRAEPSDLTPDELSHLLPSRPIVQRF